jgi:Kef-type K+ transport system membrane component KefB
MHVFGFWIFFGFLCLFFDFFIVDLVLTVITVCLALSFIFSEAFYRLRYPKVLGQILAGVFLGVSFFSDVMRNPQVYSFIASLSELGIVFIMLLVGAKMKIHDFYKVSGKAVLLAFLGYIIPFGLGFMFMYALGFFGIVEVGFLGASIVGICLALSAVDITLDILMEYGLLKTQTGALITEAGMLDDIFGVMSIALVIAYSEGASASSLIYMPVDFLAFIVVAYVLGFAILPRAAKAVWREKSEPAIFSLAAIFGLIVVLLSGFFGLSSVIGAFVAGVIINMSVKNRKEEAEIVESLEIVTFGLIIPFFYIYVGLNLDLSQAYNNLALIAAVTAIALFGKMAAAYALAALSHLKKSQASLIGWALNPRGVLELVVAGIAFERHLISEVIFTAIVSMAVLSCIISPIMFKRSCDRDIMSCGSENHKPKRFRNHPKRPKSFAGSTS